MISTYLPLSFSSFLRLVFGWSSSGLPKQMSINISKYAVSRSDFSLIFDIVALVNTYGCLNEKIVNCNILVQRLCDNG